MNNSNMRRRHFEPALKKAKIGHIRFHDLRHTYASLMIEQGENIKYIQAQLGHSTPTVTLNNLCAPDEIHTSGGRNPARKGHFLGNQSQNSHSFKKHQKPASSKSLPVQYFCQLLLENCK